MNIIDKQVQLLKEDLKRQYNVKSSAWKFKSPIQFTGNQIKKMISDEKIKSRWKELKQELINSEGSEEETREKMRDISLEIGSMILKKSKSKISDIETKDNLSIEGLAIPFKGDLYKITGDFGTIYRNRERPPNFTNNLLDIVGNKILKIKLKKIDKRNVEKYGNISNLLKERNPKKDYSEFIKENEKKLIMKEIDEVSKDIKNYQGNIQGIDAKGWDSLLYDLQEFKKDIKKAESYFDVAKAYFENMFWQKSEKLSK